MKKILFSLVTVLMGVMLFSSCTNEDQLGVDKYNAYKENFENKFGKIHPNQNFNTQKTVTIQATTGKQGNYTLKVYDGKPGKKSTSLLGQFENLNGNSVTPVKVDVSKSLKNIYCVADDGNSKKLLTAPVPTSGNINVEPRQFNPWSGEEYYATRQSLTVAFEDLGSTDDFDFNDVVITVDYVNGADEFDITLQAVGGVLPVHLYFAYGRSLYPVFDGKELHEVMGYDTKTIINTNCKTTNGVVGVDNVRPVTETFKFPLENIGDDGVPFVLWIDSNDDQEQIQITGTSEAGKVPQVLVLGKYYSEPEDFELRAPSDYGEGFFSTPYYWVWPKERTSITDAYPEITNWLQNDPDDMSFIANPDEDQLYDGYNPNQGPYQGDDAPAGVEAVDLGLPSGTLWANMNYGAESVTETGVYLSWAEWFEKDEYTLSTYFWYDTDENEYQINSTEIQGSDQLDVVYMDWGGRWSMPNAEQIQELIDNCTSTWTTLNGVKGMEFKGRNGNTIFLPAGGLNGDPGEYGYGNYWSSTSSGNEYEGNRLAYILNFGWSAEAHIEEGRYYSGLLIRPVKAGKTTQVETTLKAVDLGLTSGTKWANMNVGANSSIALGDLFAWAECDPYSEMGSAWSMPTVDMFGELVEECTIEWTTVNGVEGAKFIGPNGNSIFMPANFNDPADPAYECRYWSSDFFQGEDDLAYALMYGDGYGGPGAGLVKTSKYCVRAVQTDVPSPNYQAIDLGLPSGTKWANMNVGAMTAAHYGFLYTWGSCNAADQMGTGWSVPTKAQYDELFANSDIEWSSLYLVEGVKVTGPNGKSIFLPVSYYDESEGWWECRYWTKDSFPDEDDLAYALLYGESYSAGGAGVGFPKTGKYAVRAVKN